MAACKGKTTDKSKDDGKKKKFIPFKKGSKKPAK